jgi:hypothetical protein
MLPFDSKLLAGARELGSEARTNKTLIFFFLFLVVTLGEQVQQWSGTTTVRAENSLVCSCLRDCVKCKLCRNCFIVLFPINKSGLH